MSEKLRVNWENHTVALQLMVIFVDHIDGTSSRLEFKIKFGRFLNKAMMPEQQAGLNLWN